MVSLAGNGRPSGFGATSRRNNLRCAARRPSRGVLMPSKCGTPRHPASATLSAARQSGFAEAEAATGRVKLSRTLWLAQTRGRCPHGTQRLRSGESGRTGDAKASARTTKCAGNDLAAPRATRADAREAASTLGAPKATAPGDSLGPNVSARDQGDSGRRGLAIQEPHRQLSEARTVSPARPGSDGRHGSLRRGFT